MNDGTTSTNSTVSVLPPVEHKLNDDNSRQQSRQSDSVTSLPPAKQNGALVTNGTHELDNNASTKSQNNNSNKSKPDVRVTHGQDGYFRHKKISSPPMKKKTKPRTGSAPTETPKEHDEETPRLHINNLIGFDKNDQKSQNNSRGQRSDENTGVRIAKTRDSKGFSNSEIKAKTDNPSNYATKEQKSEDASSSVKAENVNNELQHKDSTSSQKETQKSVVKNPPKEDKRDISNSNSSKTNGKIENSSSDNVKSDNVTKSSEKLDNDSSSKQSNDRNVSDKHNKKPSEEKSPKPSENVKSETDKNGFQYHAESREYTIHDKSSDKENEIPPLNLSNKPKTVNGVFKFTIHKNRTYQSKRNPKRWSSKSDPTSLATQNKERPKSILANQQNVKPIIKNRPRTFRMDDKEKSIYRTTTFLWDADTSEAYHTPAVNRSKGITKTYTGETNIREALKSARGQKGESPRPKSTKSPFVFQRRSKVPPWYEKAKVLSRQQVNIYQNIQSTYGEEATRRKRENQFLEKVEQCQIEQTRQEYEEIMERERKRKEAKRAQARQLKQLRKRFEDEAWHRFQTQYVTSRILEHEKLNRYEYGLPEDPAGEPEYATKLKRKKKLPGENMTVDKLKKVNQKKYGKMFKMKLGPQNRPKTPLMEGIDTVVITQTDNNGETKTLAFSPEAEKGESEAISRSPVRKKGVTKEQKRMVKNVITEAQDELLKVPKKGSGLTPRLTPRETSEVENEVSRKTPSLNFDDDEDDDDMSDIFEHARKKYNLDIDED